ncbi:MAG: YqgE/AlgH family protein [Planctomycetia bacterium]|jgi:putative transcriptional regulator
MAADKILRGKLLVADPHLPDANFFRSVVFLIEHNEEGAIGLVLNRTSERSIAELWDEISEKPCESEAKIDLGGPVEGPLMAIHTLPHLAELEIIPGIFFAAQRDHLDDLVHTTQSPYRLFVGHSGWGPGQLEQELDEGFWLVTEPSNELIFHSADGLWEQAAKQVGDSVLRDSIHIRHIPDDPSMN